MPVRRAAGFRTGVLKLVVDQRSPGQRATGWVAVSALARIYAHGGYDWLDAYTPVERIGKTIDLYYVPADGAADASHP